MIIHKEDINKPGYYSCNHAVGPGKKEKLRKLWRCVNCENCIKRYKDKEKNKKIEPYKKIEPSSPSHPKKMYGSATAMTTNDSW
jgi:hypothetical protein